MLKWFEYLIIFSLSWLVGFFSYYIAEWIVVRLF